MGYKEIASAIICKQCKCPIKDDEYYMTMRIGKMRDISDDDLDNYFKFVNKYHDEPLCSRCCENINGI